MVWNSLQYIAQAGLELTVVLLRVLLIGVICLVGWSLDLFSCVIVTASLRQFVLPVITLERRIFFSWLYIAQAGP